MPSRTFSGAHLNPAVTIGLVSIGKFAWAKVPMYIAPQLLGAFLGATIVWLAYLATKGTIYRHARVWPTGATLSALARLGLLAGSLNSQGRPYFVDISDLVRG